eukprot:SAG25_NODE_2551_length_1538_cov_262.391244_3_plen_89_part_00
MSSGGESLRMNRLPPRLPTNRHSVGAVMISGTKVQQRPQPLPPLSSPPPPLSSISSSSHNPRISALHGRGEIEGLTVGVALSAGFKCL